MRTLHRITTVPLVTGLCVLLSAIAVAQSSLEERTARKLEAAMNAPSRPERDKERDDNRKPLETLGFFGFEDDMTVLELVPGGGWYTRLLMPTLAEEGQLYLSIGTGRISNLSDVDGYEKAKILDVADFGDRQPSGRYDVAPFSFGVDDVDLVLTFRNMHNFSESGRANINEAAFDALKSGGHYGVVDHTRRHMQPDYVENRRRMDPVLIIREVQAAGFEFVESADLHYKPDDELRYEVGRMSVTGNTDRFTLLFRKP